jgi:hypothetical protein
MDINTLSKQELLKKCKEFGLTNYSSKNKSQLIEISNNYKNDNDNRIISDIEKKTTPHPLKHLKPLIKWSGGKGDEIKQFENYFPSEYDTYIEPFIGGGSVYFYLAPKKAVISDVDSALVDFYNCFSEA